MKILNDFSTSIHKALSEIDPNYMDYEGLVICGTHSPNLMDSECMITEIENARKNQIPYLGICFGHQLAFIEYCRSKGMIDATSEEWGRGRYVVLKRPEGLKVGLHEGETYWNNYEIDQTIDWTKPSWFITTQAHPEYQSSKDKPHPLLVKFLDICKNSGK